MFSSLGENLNRVFKNLSGRGRLSEDNINQAMREVRVALLEADVALPVVKTFIDDVKQKAIGQEVIGNVDPGQAVVKLVNDEMIKALGETHQPLNLATTPPAVILMAGLQGSGKTTTTAKLAKFLKENEKKKVLVTSCDIYRPAAIEQLKRLAQAIDVDYFPSQTDQQPKAIAQAAVKHATNHYHDVLIIDTAGRLHIDQDMMDEIKTIHQHVNPVETLFVVDSMTGQDAANTAKAFNDALALTGVVLTKTDGDARGGAALSMRLLTGKPIKFIGAGEKTDALEAFYPERIASRILGMGDIVGLVEEAERKIDKKKSQKMVKKLRKGKEFTFDDLADQLEQMSNMGGMAGLMGKLPGMGNMKAMAEEKLGDKSVTRMVAIIRSMTEKERQHPKLINGSRKRRIAAGSGTEIKDVNQLMKQFTQMQKMMKKMAKPGAMKKLLRGGFPGLPPM